MRGQRVPGRESVPNSLTPPPGYEPTVTALQAAHRAASSQLRARLSPTGTGRPLSPRAVAMLGKPCPGGWESDQGYCKHGCRCEACRAAHRAKRLRRLHIQREREAA